MDERNFHDPGTEMQKVRQAAGKPGKRGTGIWMPVHKENKTGRTGQEAHRRADGII